MSSLHRSQSLCKMLPFLLLALCQTVYSQLNESNGTFYYFAYGSNLLERRIHINNPSATFVGPALLKNHRLDFDLFVAPWNGAVATIVEHDGHRVWGALWTLDLDQIRNLDKQEGVDKGWYFAKQVVVTTGDGRKVSARTYELVHNPPYVHGDLPPERRPSNTYLEVIALGAIECRMPSEYIGYLFSFPTNGKLATQKRRDELGYPF